MEGKLNERISMCLADEARRYERSESSKQEIVMKRLSDMFAVNAVLALTILYEVLLGIVK